MNSILVVGLATVDLIYYLEKLPNKGIKYVSKKQIISTGGNASNASIAISRLGGSVVFVSKIGNDFFGNYILTELKSENINTDHMIVKNDINTSNSCVTIDNEGERQIINFRSKKIDFKDNSKELDSLSIAKDLSLDSEKLLDREKIFSILNGSSDNRISKVFELRYFEKDNKNLPWRNLGKKMNLSSQTVINLHRKGLSLIKRKINSFKNA